MVREIRKNHQSVGSSAKDSLMKKGADDQWCQMLPGHQGDGGLDLSIRNLTGDL